MLNLRVNYPSIPQEMDVFEKYTAGFTAPDKYQLLRTPSSFYVSNRDAETVLNWLKCDIGRISETSDVVTIPSANSALFCILSLFKGREQEVGVENNTFPGFKMCAQHFGYKLGMIECDEYGIIPEALEQYLATGKSRLVYIQPTVHNPSCFVMPLERRLKIAEIVKSFKDVYLLEDDAYRFLHDNPPPAFLNLLPERTIHVYSLSKPFNPFLKSAYIVHPKNLLPGLENLIRLTTSSGCSLFADFGRWLMESGELQLLMLEKQRIAKDLKLKIDTIFTGLDYNLFPGSFHIWLSLGQLDTYQFTDFLRSRDIDVMDGADFSLTDNRHRVRIALGSEWSSPDLLPALALIGETVRREQLV
ncbi:aminotransferase class I/II-fold pyridoxal phosphate-dependent enzyme [uncultured Chitinophaga sp.]|uniref:aminotransferase class I/II-fold pyridoxal phosphate-dependent enzyme n=1 Tax=uncultured Chitinophaga sp. TaxID=339340 RepID=UPI0025E2D22E|nr:aminotransferase class I/II-fold pyridoxal phosphate-dependent enzyme [uncultured Chitinophaga sp.]